MADLRSNLPSANNSAKSRKESCHRLQLLQRCLGGMALGLIRTESTGQRRVNGLKIHDNEMATTFLPNAKRVD